VVNSASGVERDPSSISQTLRHTETSRAPGAASVTATAELPAPALCGIRALRSAIAELVQGAELARSGSTPLELMEDLGERAALVGCQLLEPSPFRARAVGEPVPMFRAFLDGKQKSEEVAFVRGAPLIAGAVAAVIRERGSSGTTTWGMKSERRLYAPLSLVGSLLPDELHARIAVVDTSSDMAGEAGDAMRHPLQLRRRAYHLVQRARENLEQLLAEDWSESGAAQPLLVDGSISRMSRGGDMRPLIGLVKSHRTMYLTGDEVETVVSLQAGERSSTFLVESRNGPVASWYLRLRREPGRDPLWGLVRVEIPPATFSARRAEEVSRWVLAESTPLSLPDSRWDRLVYGVRDCEMFLEAVM
jgi:hypothetical protein